VDDEKMCCTIWESNKQSLHQEDASFAFHAFSSKKSKFSKSTDYLPKAKSCTFRILFIYFSATTQLFLLLFYDASTFSHNIPAHTHSSLRTTLTRA